MSRTVFLHVGIAKTGTTYLQRTLYSNRTLLERHGTQYPGPGPAAHFFGSLDLRGASFQGHDYSRSRGAWKRLVAQADAFSGNTLISHETLAHAAPADITRAVGSFATDDVRVVITCRDLARQLPAMWQEKIKNRSTTPYSRFLAKVFADWSAAGGPSGSFWRAQHVEGLVGRWAAQVGARNVYVVTVPPRGADPGELWSRFARATDLPDLAYGVDGGNTSMGVAEAEMLRRLNPLLADVLDWPQYDGVVKKGLAPNVLASLSVHGKLGLPQEWHAQVVEIAASTVAFLKDSDVRLIGDVDDLLPVLDTEEGRQPDDLDDADVLDVALEVVARQLTQQRPPAAPDEPMARRALDRLRDLRNLHGLRNLSALRSVFRRR